ncbi:MAG: phosphonate ABC transporter, permease protein PhnE [Nitrospinae bacterium CG11_big_fil_rev_8_21_14_0_20_45_15]|nr:MAG: phosphonate ABC transporter, permease protein PhnE [Nitrospinae bacterium CG11_big_fil_rev_8_21_14_0_20_45_15]
MKSAPRPFYARTRFLFISLIVLVVYGYGWKITGIDLGEIVRGAPMIRPLVVNLLSPDLIRYEKKSEIKEAFFVLEDQGGFPGVSSAKVRDTSLTVVPSLGKVGDKVVVRGKDLPADREGNLMWINSIEQEYPLATFKTNSAGEFELEVVVPQTARGEEQTLRAAVFWETGEWSMSPTLKLVAEKMVETIFLALMATSFAFVVAAPLSFLAAKNLMWKGPVRKSLYLFIRTLFNILRSIEPLILAILFAVWVGIGPFAGVLALGVHSIATLGKLFSEQIETIDPGPIEAITATGASALQVAWFAVVPQVTASFLALTFYRWDINVRMSTIIGFVGGGGIGFLLQQWINLLQYNQAGTALLSIALVVITLDLTSAWIRQCMALKE